MPSPSAAGGSALPHDTKTRICSAKRGQIQTAQQALPEATSSVLLITKDRNFYIAVPKGADENARIYTMYAVIKTGGKQYRVAADDVIKIEKIAGEVGETISFDDVLMVGGDTPQIGAPLVDGASVAGEVVEQGRARKIIVFKKKRRQNYRRKKGHRQEQTTVRITDILTGGKSVASAAKKTAAKKPSPKKPAAAKDDAGRAAAGSGEIPQLFTPPAGDGDDLTRINGVGPVIVAKLNAMGVTTFGQIAAWTPDDVAKVDEVLNFKGRIDRDAWLDQARTLAEEA
ncbi:MAG: 50S ribosomal protein L21 [Hyphomicrobiaceae bacterium]